MQNGLPVEYLVSQFIGKRGARFRVDYSYTGGYGPNSYEERSFVLGKLIEFDREQGILVFESEHMGTVSTEHFPILSEKVTKVSFQNENGGSGDIPASDRLVTLNHNEPDYLELVDAVDQAEEIIRSTNEDYGGEKEQLLSEISLGKQLLKSLRVRVLAVTALLLAPIYTAYQSALSEAAKPVLLEVIGKIKVFFGL